MPPLIHNRVAEPSFTVEWFPTIYEAVQNAPKRWTRDRGYVYAVFLKDGTIKVGSSCCPKLRIGQSYYPRFGGRAAFVEVGLGRFRDAEKQFHLAMRPLNARIGCDIRTETYRVKNRRLRRLIIKAVDCGFTEESISLIRECALRG